MASPSKKHIGKTTDITFPQSSSTRPQRTDALTVDSVASPQLQKLLELSWTGYASLDPATRGMIEEVTREIQQRLKRTLQDVYFIGKRLNQVREILIPIRGAFSTWVHEEFEVKYGLTERLSEHWMNIAKRFTEAQIDKFINLKLPLSALYHVAAPSTPDGAADKIINTIEKTFPYVRYRKIPGTLIKQLVQEYKEEAEWALKNIKFKEAGIAPEIQGMLLSTPVAEDTNELRWLGRFEPTIQSKIAEKLFTGEAKSVRQANRQLAAESTFTTLTPEQSPAKLGGEADLISQGASILAAKDGQGVEVETKVTYYPGEWRALVQHIPVESIDFCFAEIPLEHDFLPIYPAVAQALLRVLRPGGKALITAGHRNIQFIGPMLEPPLRISWTHIIRRESRRNLQATGPHIATGSVLMSLVYREPWSLPKGLAQDTRDDPGWNGKLINGLEEAICHYSQHYTNQQDTILHLIVGPLRDFNIASAMRKFAQTHHRQLIGLGSVG